MGSRPWWERVLLFLRELLCTHCWQYDVPYSDWRFCPRCGATELHLLRYRETKHETSDREDHRRAQGRS
jgi:predicted amidophosphoribosyltransferase